MFDIKWIREHLREISLSIVAVGAVVTPPDPLSLVIWSIFGLLAVHAAIRFSNPRE